MVTNILCWTISRLSGFPRITMKLLNLCRFAIAALNNSQINIVKSS